MKPVEKEIHVLEGIIKLLNRCLKVSLKNYNFKHAKRTKLDIQVCKKELEKLLVAKEGEQQAIKEQEKECITVKQKKLFKMK
jgi:hypothetical protein